MASPFDDPNASPHGGANPYHWQAQTNQYDAFGVQQRAQQPQQPNYEHQHVGQQHYQQHQYHQQHYQQGMPQQHYQQGLPQQYPQLTFQSQQHAPGHFAPHTASQPWTFAPASPFDAPDARQQAPHYQAAPPYTSQTPDSPFHQPATAPSPFLQPVAPAVESPPPTAHRVPSPAASVPTSPLSTGTPPAQASSPATPSSSEPVLSKLARFKKNQGLTEQPAADPNFFRNMSNAVLNATNNPSTAPVRPRDLPRCAHGASCPYIENGCTDRTHACSLQHLCADQTGAHRSFFTHDDHDLGHCVRKECPDSPCPLLRDERHLRKFSHACVVFGCNDNSALHRWLLTHSATDGVFPRPERECSRHQCQDTSESHLREFLHVCRDASSACHNTSHAHRQLWYHPPVEFCLHRISCPYIHQTDLYAKQHLDEHRHHCPAPVGRCDDKTMLHKRRFAHPTGPLQRCQNSSCASSSDPKHRWEVAHPCLTEMCVSNEAEHHYTTYHPANGERATSGQLREAQVGHFTTTVLATTSTQYAELTRIFAQSLQGKTVVEIKSIDNAFMRGQYEVVKHDIAKRCADNGGSRDANEALMAMIPLQNKAKSSYIYDVDSICREGYSYRVCSEGTLGEGLHFTLSFTDIQSLISADSGGARTIVVWHVARGNIQATGQPMPSNRRTNDPHHSVQYGNIVCVYNMAQALPAYLIRYK